MSFFRRVDSDSDTESESEEELLSSDEETQQQKTTAGGPKKGSAFLRSDGSDDSDSDDSDSDDDESELSDSDAEKKGKGKPAVNKFLRGAASDSDSEEEVKKIIKSAKDKRADEIQAVVDTIEKASRIGDWVAISKEFDSLNRLCERQRTVGEAVPVVYIKCLVDLEDTVQQSLAKEKENKKMKQASAKALAAMKQKLRKVAKDNEGDIAAYKKDPEAFEKAAAAAQAPVEPVQPARKAAKAATGAAGEQQETDEFQTVGRGGRTMVISSEALFKTMAAIMEARGKKSTDRAGQVDTLLKLSEVAVSTYQEIRVLLALLAVRFDYNTTTLTHMPQDQWSAAREHIDKLLEIVIKDSSYTIEENTEEYDDQIDRLPNQNGEGAVVKVRGSIISFIDRLDDEFTKSLQNIDPHTPEYVERLSDEKRLYATMIRAQHYFEARSQDEQLDRVIMRRLEHIYAKPEAITQALEAAAADAYAAHGKSQLAPAPEVIAQKGGSSKLVHALCVRLYKSRGTAAERARTRAMLCHIYHHALHVHYQLARDMFLMSHLQEAISMADAATQILYNRVIVQLGICAFRVGLVREAHTALQDIFGSGRVRELLAQGVQRPGQYNNITPEQEKLDRQRQLPFHLHINLELLECIYLVASMLLEIPNMAFAGNDPELRKRVISRTFRRMLDYTDRQVFSGPPENTRDHVMQASKALQNGDWQTSVEMINDIGIWKLMPNSERVKKMIARKIQTEGLRTYLFTYASFYDTVSFDHLCATFDLSVSDVRAVVSKMIWTEELPASLDPFNNVIVLHRQELSKVQQLAQTLADKVAYTLDQNEKTLAAEAAKQSGEARGDRPGGDRDRNENGPRREGGRRMGGGGGGGRGRGRGRSHFGGFSGGYIGQKV